MSHAMNTARLHLMTLLMRCLSSSLRAVLVLSVSVSVVLLFAILSLASLGSDPDPEVP
jgi:hypothetical protein